MAAAIRWETGQTSRATKVPRDVTLSPRALNRALLARQLLLRRQRRRALAVVEYLVGMQAQEPLDPYVGLWTRLDGFKPAELADAIVDRRVVRTALMRSTIHLVTADDCLTLRPALQVVQERGLTGNFGRHLDGVDRRAVAEAGRALVEERPRTFGELGKILAEQSPGRDPLALAMAVRVGLALVQPPPRGVWGKGGRALHTTVEQWLGRPLGEPIALDDLVLRYLAAFGPASARDVQVWCGLTGLRDTFERLRPGLRTFRDENGAELFDLPDAPRPDPSTPAPVRFLPQYDNVLLSHADRARVVEPDVGQRIHLQHGHWSPLLIDGFLRGTWKLFRERGGATLAIELADPPSAAEREAVTEEGDRLLRFTAPEARERAMRFVPW
jgi:Winged helix DNA-binding domain